MMNVRSKLMVTGHGRHGKDTVCELLRDKYGYTFQSSSMAAAEIFIFDTLCELMGYESLEECYEDRHNKRELWFELIKAINHKDLTTLGRAIYDKNDIYCGIRNVEEFKALQKDNVFDIAIWVDGSKRHPPESNASCTVTKHDCDIVLDNNGTLEDLEKEVDSLVTHLKGLENEAAKRSEKMYRGVPTGARSEDRPPNPRK